MKRIAPEALYALPTLDESLEYIWRYFVDVFSGELLTYQELQAWASLTGKRLNSTEVWLLRVLSMETVKVQRNG